MSAQEWLDIEPTRQLTELKRTADTYRLKVLT